MIELPVIGQHGVLNDLHSFFTPQKAIDHLKSASARTYGSLLRSFIELITTDVVDLNQYVPKELQRIVDSWLLPDSSSQVQRVTRRFALILVALQLASRNFLVNWSEDESEQAVHSLYRVWLGSRGHLMNLEEYSLLQKIGGVLAKWDKRLAKEGDVYRPTSIGYRR
ncbi:helicase, partial [Salmonella enterica subsp. enterica serovar Montevideo]|nr:helicase [Salmonella enterica subsp. enterica serovar Montevideo]